MSTRLDKTERSPNSAPMGHEGNNIPDDFHIEPCSLEDVDRALFNLFNEDIPLFYMIKNQETKIPVVFSGGERAILMRRVDSIANKAGSLILPIISIRRTGIDFSTPNKGRGVGQNHPVIVKRRLGKDDPAYQNLVNKLDLRNQDNVASDSHLTDAVNNRQGTTPGTVATREKRSPVVFNTRKGQLLEPNVEKNIFEIIEIPQIKYFTSKYEIKFRSQYVQQMNDMLMVMTNSFHSMNQRTFRIESDKGYWFVAYTDSLFNADDKGGDTTDAERVIEYSFTMEVGGYSVAPEYPGSENPVRRFFSAPRVSFGVEGILASPREVAAAGEFTLEELDTNLNTKTEDLTVLHLEKDPFTGKVITGTVKIKSRNQRKGETVYRAGITKNLRWD